MMRLTILTLALALMPPVANATISPIDRQHGPPTANHGQPAGLAGNTFHIEWVKPDNTKGVGVMTFTEKAMTCRELGLQAVSYTKSGGGKAPSAFTVNFSDAEGNSFEVSGSDSGGKLSGTYTYKPKKGAQVSFSFASPQK